MSTYEKVYIVVIARVETDGDVYPLRVLWQDGSTYDIDSIVEIRRAPARYVGGFGTRYTCRIMGKSRELYLEDSKRWFVEKAVNI